MANVRLKLAVNSRVNKQVFLIIGNEVFLIDSLFIIEE